MSEFKSALIDAVIGALAVIMGYLLFKRYDAPS